ncbi:anti-sigma regulatory factor (Ser/Thr protein kinase) [Streptomyces sp. V3I8]|uniref:ATP-binding protein n=1 Tax=Streptomyces sp. V3I8 TaxID=3042279 RepID=UPI0027865B19|nr:ATP-binding protein [Streptomyces sp. V3I8]MDQ1036348.1 anti-sigma regulatory factor (Ser/Thr protein kinase) [Streptomyces sp. V3I8]
MIQETATSEARPARPARTFSVQLSPTPRGARLARLLATEQLRSWGFPLDPARHLVAELAANAATHSRVPGRDFRLVLHVVASTLRIEVTDTCGGVLPRPLDPAPDSESGRGLVLVVALADRWGVTRGPHPRRTVWAELNPAPEPDRTCSGDRGALPKEPGEGKDPTEPHPALPPASARPHPGE